MALTINKSIQDRLPEADLAVWRKIPSAIISDELNRSATMVAAIKPLVAGTTFAAQALTAQVMVGDNAPLHHGVLEAWPGCAIAIDARGHVDTAVWGGVLTYMAKARGVAAVIVDGAIRDVAELRDSGIAIYCRGAVPNGPHKGFGGSVNVPIQCGGATVDPGDLLVGDDDGIVVIRPGQMAGLLDRCKARIAHEEEILRQIDAGKSTVEITGIPAPDKFK
ncbi:MAG: RraA family protein [Proteobacteria bacterium]|nr:RraA family protein [Pseudomonadota bacterium]